MRSELVIKGRSLAGSSDLTLLASIKPGLAPSLESVTYKTRVKRLLKMLNSGRSSSHEYALLRPISDAVERVGVINSVRVAVFEPEDKVLLSVTFDGVWESYIRVLWQKVGALLDVIFCNTVDYVSAYDHSFEEWVGWANRVQTETAFFYGMPTTVDDVKYLRGVEALRRTSPNGNTDLDEVAHSIKSAEMLAWEASGATPFTRVETALQGLQSLAVLYRMADLYVPGREDGQYLHRAARELLLEFREVIRDPALQVPARQRFGKQLDWLLADPIPPRAEPPDLPTALPQYERADVQGGIVHGYDNASNGRLLLIAFDSPAAAAGFLDRLVPQITTDDKPPKPREVARNAAFTYDGLRAAGLSEKQLAWFPQEFREGMAARASVLGDFRSNHPRRWSLPVSLGPALASGEPGRVELSQVHVIVQMRVGTAVKVAGPDPSLEALLEQETRTLLEGLDGVRLLSVQPMVRYRNPQGKTREHFGFVDGISQPTIDPAAAGSTYSNQIQLGELLLGYANEADDAPKPRKGEDPADARERLEFMRNGSFLVVRKLKQEVQVLRDAVADAQRATGLGEEAIYGKMMGRTPQGDPLAAPGGDNDFDYTGANQSACPFQAHIRRANPRRAVPQFHEPLGARSPRLMRRGMSYGPLYDVTDKAAAVNQEERGLVFMAYNASISEQFEVIQRWINGGNSAGVFSSHSDPFLGVPENGQKRHMRFAYQDASGADRTHSMPLDGSSTLLADPKPFTRLEWGAYLFTPSLHALWALKKTAEGSGALPVPVWSAEDGQKTIEQLQKLEGEQGRDAAALAWKSILEDPEAQEKFVSASVWAAIRNYHGGVLSTPYGVLVADRDLVMEVFVDQGGNYSVSGYHERMENSIGEIFLGLDRESPGGPYDQQSIATRAAIENISFETAFDQARGLANGALDALINGAKAVPSPSKPGRWELNFDAKEVVDPVLAGLCELWFGLEKDSGFFQRGGSRWDWKRDDPPFYPGNFTAPSRYIFQPRPGKTVEHFGQEYGATLTAAMRRFIAFHREHGTRPVAPGDQPAPVADAIFGAFNDPARDDLIARTMVGAMMGFLPTIDGNVRLSLNEWLKDGSFWSLRTAMAIPDASSPAARATRLLRRPLVEAMQLRPSPELVWRTAKRRTTLGNVGVEQGEVVVLSIVSATQQCLERNDADVFHIFGGQSRTASSPTHSCPGYKAAMGALMGILSALLEVKESMRASPAPLAFTLEGPYVQTAAVTRTLF